MRREPVVIGQILNALMAMSVIFYPPLNDAIMAAGGTTAVVTAIGTFVTVVTVLTRGKVTPVDQ